MNNRYMGWLMTGLLVALFFIGQAHGQTKLYWENGNIVGSASQANINQFYRNLPAYASAQGASKPVSAVVNGSLVTFERAATLELAAGSGFGTAVKVAVRDVVTSPISSLARGASLACRATPAGVAATVIGSLLLDQGIRYVSNQWMKDGVPEQAPNGKPYPQSSGYWSMGGNYPSGTYDEVCQRSVAYWNGASPSYSYVYTGWRSVSSTQGYCQETRTYKSTGAQQNVEEVATLIAGKCASGHTLSNGMCVPPGYVAPQQTAPATDAQLESAMTQAMALHPEKAMDVVNSIYPNGGFMVVGSGDSAGWTLPSTPIKGQPTVTKSTSTGADGVSYTTTTTTTPTVNLSSTGSTAADNSLTYNVTNNTTTTVTNNNTGETKTTGQGEDAPIVFQDSAMPDVPKLYTQKYPDGIAGVWRDSHPDVQSTAFFQGVKSMFPSFGAGQCPVWRMTFNLGKPGNFGTGDLTVPCWIFQALGLVILATAAFTARKIIF